jgi:hypothetical protein
MSNYPEIRARTLVATTGLVPQSTMRELWIPELDAEEVTSWVGRKAGRLGTRGSTVAHVSNGRKTEGFHEAYLARADFVKRNKSKCLCKHGAGKILFGQQQGHGDQREQNLRDESERLDTDADVGRLLRAEVQ